MIAGLRAVWRGLRHLNERGYTYIWTNVLWALLTLPLVTAPAAWAGLVKVSHAAQTQPRVEIGLFWDGFRQNLRRGLVMFVLNVIVIVVNVVNLAAYGGQTGLAASFARGVWILALAVWLALQLYLWPLLYEMKQPRLLGAMRNALVMMYLNPLFTLTVVLCALLIVFVSTVLMTAWILVSGSALAAIATSAVFDRLEAAGLRQRPAKAEAEVLSASEWE